MEASLLKHGASTKEEVGYESSRGRDIRFLQSPEGTHRVEHNQVQLLGLAVSAGRLQDVRELLEAAADINYQTKEGNTPCT